jgi:putative transposase
LDLRERVVAAVEAGASRHAAARQFRVSPSSAIKWVQRFRATGSAAAAKMGGRRRAPLNEQRVFLLSLVAEQPDLTLEEIRAKLKARQVLVCVTAIWRFFERNGISFKKNRARRRTGSARRGREARAMAPEPALARSQPVGLS